MSARQINALFLLNTNCNKKYTHVQPGPEDCCRHFVSGQLGVDQVLVKPVQKCSPEGAICCKKRGPLRSAKKSQMKFTTRDAQLQFLSLSFFLDRGLTNANATAPASCSTNMYPRYATNTIFGMSNIVIIFKHGQLVSKITSPRSGP